MGNGTGTRIRAWGCNRASLPHGALNTPPSLFPPRSRPLLRLALRHNIIVVIIAVTGPFASHFLRWGGTDGMPRAFYVHPKRGHITPLNNTTTTTKADQMAPAGWVTLLHQHTSFHNIENGTMDVTVI